MRTRTTTAGILAALAITLTACSSTEEPAAVDQSSQPPALSDADKAKIREDLGYPPKPDAATADAFIKALNAIDTDIVHGKDEKALSRGADTCRMIKDHPERAKQIEQTNKRWTSPTHPDGHGLATAEKILDAAHKHLCPDF
ncbi:hypothetical protein [Streptomyces sp. I4(2020)]|uniref:hypothetical protein n=1 Tax=Streptomyces sp. I4(2020) TaxID=2760981 RepID=UPI0018EEB212|nr:hypothetical protein [Streptomyces sp. I4(2020)]MBJ6615551.1 hypothetical protein [Streptomyces sp. I3(2020)]MBJ6626048.1 hypothetical protein [Streptomyces sp. I4(2020)]